MNQLLTRLVKDVLVAALAVATGGGDAGAGEGDGCCCGGGADAAVPAVAAGAGGGASEPVKPVSEEHPAKAVSAIMPAMVLRKLRHSVPSLAPRSTM